ncbi:MAG: hypothetical protein KDC45_00500 [Bacteroidetes bacterium]|nr:hypothetical protein [Bacteroidota bacterium]
MNFPLLEALLSQNVELVEKELASDHTSVEKRESSIRALIVFAAHYLATPDMMDPFVLSTAFARSANSPEEFGPRAMALFNYAISQNRIPLDSALLKPLDGKNQVVSVRDLDHALSKGSFEEVVHVVRDLLSIMDNKSYFSELLFRVALERNVQSINAVHAFSTGVDLIGWKNHFTPFLILHVIQVLCRANNDLTTISSPESKTDWPNSHISCLADLELYASCCTIRRSAKLLSKDLEQRLAKLWNVFFAGKRSDNWQIPLDGLDEIRFRGALATIGEDLPSAFRDSKISLEL